MPVRIGPSRRIHLGCTESLWPLYFSQLNHNPDFKMDGKEKICFSFLNGATFPSLVFVLSRSGYFSPEERNTIRKLNSRLQGHPAQGEDFWNPNCFQVL